MCRGSAQPQPHCICSSKPSSQDTEGEGRSESLGGRTTLTGTRQGSAITEPRTDILANTGRVNNKTSAAESLIHTKNNTSPQEGLPRDVSYSAPTNTPPSLTVRQV